MNGAMAEPLVSTISAPNTSSTTMTGSSQNFFRSTEKPPEVLQKFHARFR